MLDNYKHKFIPLILPIILILFWYGITDGFLRPVRIQGYVLSYRRRPVIWGSGFIFRSFEAMDSDTAIIS